jgi:hypothetical protein
MSQLATCMAVSKEQEWKVFQLLGGVDFFAETAEVYETIQQILKVFTMIDNTIADVDIFQKTWEAKIMENWSV